MITAHNALALFAGGCLGGIILLAFDARREPTAPAPASNLCIVQVPSATAPPAIVVIDCGKERAPAASYAVDDSGEDDFEQRPLEEVRRMPHP